VVLGESFVALILSNTLYGVAISWYWYITHLGYRTLPFLKKTEVFLLPVAVVIALYVLMMVGYPFGYGYNASRVMARFYFI
jgi:UNC-50 family